MLNRTHSIIYSLGLILLILSACTPTKNVTESPLPSATIRTVTAPATVTVLATLIPSPTPSATIVPVPTFSQENAYPLLANLLKNNDGCQLPCWWGLTPGKSTSSDAYAKLMAFGGIASPNDLYYSTGGVMYLIYPKHDLSIYINVGTQSDLDKDTIKMIHVSTQVLRDKGAGSYETVRGAVLYNELLDSYSLPNILSKYGSPSQVLVRGDVYDYSANPDTFEITLLYPEQGIFVRYNMLGERASGKISGCPPKAFVELWLLSPNDKNSYQEILSSMDETWEGHWPYSMSVDEAAQMTLDKFYNTFKKPTNRCLETPLSFWPGH